MEAEGLFGKGGDFEQYRDASEHMTAAWDEGHFPCLHGRRPDPNFDPSSSGQMSWDLYRAMRGSHGEFVIDGNLASVEHADRLPGNKVPTLITAGGHDECDPSLSRGMQGSWDRRSNCLWRAGAGAISPRAGG